MCERIENDGQRVKIAYTRFQAGNSTNSAAAKNVGLVCVFAYFRALFG
jgi:hypothetical protein